MTDPYLSWLRADVAQGMHNLTSAELEDESHPPYKYFLMAMEELRRHTASLFRMKMIDAGCGVGHYGYLAKRHYPSLVYTGYDFSGAMVKLATRARPDLFYFQADAKTFDYSPYDIVLASSLIEVMDDWAAGAEAICKTAPGFVILHRVRIHAAPTVREDHTGYPGQPTYAWVHDKAELMRFFSERHFFAIWTKHWDEFEGGPFQMATFIFKRM